MKKIAITFFLTGLLLFCIYGAISYSSVRVDNPASLEIVSPDSNGLFVANSDANGLISFNASSDCCSVEQGGLAEGVLVVSNRLGSGIDFTFDCDSEYFTFVDNYGYGYLEAYDIGHISMSVDENCPGGEYSLIVFLNAEFPGGSAQLKNYLQVEVSVPLPQTVEKAGAGEPASASAAELENVNAGFGMITGVGAVSEDGTDAGEPGNEENAGSGAGPGDDHTGGTGTGGGTGSLDATGTVNGTDTGAETGAVDGTDNGGTAAGDGADTDIQD